jgi:GDP-6-deoxy-D-talose 4-dehydrogenase
VKDQSKYAHFVYVSQWVHRILPPAQLEVHGHIVKRLNANSTNSVAVATEIVQLKPEAVVHLAGISYVGHENARELYKVNLICTRNLLEVLD